MTNESGKPLNQTTPERIVRMRQTHREIVESDGGECPMMADYRWACDEIDLLRERVRWYESVLSRTEISTAIEEEIANAKAGE